MSLAKASSAWLLVAGTAAAAAGCGGVVADKAAGSEMRGWYREIAAGARFRPCGGDRELELEPSAELRRRTRDFDPGSPVYAVVQAHPTPDGGLAVDRVIQVGSPEPVRDCAMNGVVD